MRFRAIWLCVAAFMMLQAPARSDEPVLRIAVLKFGTVNWLMETIKTRGLDRAEGFELEVVGLAGKSATSIAFQSGDVDMIVTDWVWAMRERTGGKALSFSPYSSALGALVAREGVGDLCALKGRRVGVVGGALDKSWLVFQALADQQCGMDLAAETEALFGAPPLMSRQLQDGAVDAVSTFWHFVARLEASGKKPLIRVDAALARLGIDPAPPMIGFVWDRDRTDPAAASGFLAAVRTAGAILAQDDAAWETLRPRMRVANEAEFTALRDAYRRGIPGPWGAAQTDSARKLYDLLTQRAGAKFVEQAGPFNSAVFPSR